MVACEQVQTVNHLKQSTYMSHNNYREKEFVVGKLLRGPDSRFSISQILTMECKF